MLVLRIVHCDFKLKYAAVIDSTRRVSPPCPVPFRTKTLEARIKTHFLGRGGLLVFAPTPLPQELDVTLRARHSVQLKLPLFGAIFIRAPVGTSF